MEDCGSGVEAWWSPVLRGEDGWGGRVRRAAEGAPLQSALLPQRRNGSSEVLVTPHDEVETGTRSAHVDPRAPPASRRRRGSRHSPCYRLHAGDLPGRPDLVFRQRRKVVFVHGCFWHRHGGCARNRLPKSPERRVFWRDKLNGNARRDRKNQAALQAMGWRVLVVWECETEDLVRLANRVKAFLG